MSLLNDPFFLAAYQQVREQGHLGSALQAEKTLRECLQRLKEAQIEGPLIETHLIEAKQISGQSQFQSLDFSVLRALSGSSMKVESVDEPEELSKQWPPLWQLFCFLQQQHHSEAVALFKQEHWETAQKPCAAFMAALCLMALGLKVQALDLVQKVR